MNRQGNNVGLPSNTPERRTQIDNAELELPLQTECYRPIVTMNTYLSEDVTLNTYLSENVTLNTYLSEDVALGTYLSEDVTLNTYLSEDVTLNTYLSEDVILYTYLSEDKYIDNTNGTQHSAKYPWQESESKNIQRGIKIRGDKIQVTHTFCFLFATSQFFLSGVGILQTYNLFRSILLWRKCLS